MKNGKNPDNSIREDSKKFDGKKISEKNINNNNQNVISFFIVNEKGRLILARQVSPITKSELFYHTAYFHQILKEFSQKEDASFKSFFEHNEYRYLYYPLETKISNEKYDEKLFSVLLVNTSFNILIGLNILKMIQRIIYEIIKNNNSQDTKADSFNKEVNYSKKIKDNCHDIVFAIDDIISGEGQLEENSDGTIEKLKESLKMDSYLEKAFNLVKHEKENIARINLIKGMEEINRLKKENKYFDNSVSSDLYSKVSEVVEGLTGREEENEASNPQGEESQDIANNNKKTNGMNLKKRLVENLMQIREDSIKMTNFYINCENIFEKLENEIKKNIIAFVNEESDEEIEDQEISYSSGITIAPIQIIFKTLDSDDD